MDLCLQYQETPTNPTKTITNTIKKCSICDGDGKYKCPTCLVYYCSVACCRKHREKDCKVVKEKSVPLAQPVDPVVDVEYLTENTIPEERLQLLRNDEMLKDLLSNPHLRSVLKTVDEASNPEVVMQKAMQEPLFVEFADTCLKVVEPQSESQSALILNTSPDIE